MRRRPLLARAVSALVGTLIVGGLAAVSAPQAPAAPTTGQGDQNGSCKQVLAPRATKAMRPDGGTQEAKTSDGMARSYEYSDGTQEVAPPPGWRPRTATDQELQAYGFPPRPADAAGLAHWEETF